MKKLAQIVLIAIVLFNWGCGGTDSADVPESAVSDMGSWECITSSADFGPRDSARVFEYENKLFLSNGYYHGNVTLRDLWVSQDGAQWELISDDTPYDPYSEIVVFQDKIWAIKESVWNSNDGETWELVEAFVPFKTQKILVYKDEIWQIGKEIWSSPNGVDWFLEVESPEFGDRENFAAVVFDGKLWILGGWINQNNNPPEEGYSDYTSFNDIWCSSDGMRWELVTNAAPWQPRIWHMAVIFDDKIWLMGGFSNISDENLGDIWTSVDGVEWMEVEFDKIWAPRHWASVYVFQGDLLLMGGNGWPVLNDVWRLNPQQ